MYKEKKQQQILFKENRSAAIQKLILKGDALLDPGKYDSALFYFKKAASLCNPKADYPDDYVQSLTNIADVQQRFGDFYEAENTLTKTLPYLEKTTKAKNPVNAYALMAHNYFSIYDYDTALLYQRKAYKKAISSFRKSDILTHIAFIYIQQKKYKLAISILRPLARHKIRDKIDPPNTDVQYAALLYNLGLCYLRIGDHKELAFDCFNKSLELTIKTNNDYELIANYFSLYIFYKKYNNPELAKINAQKAYECAKRTKSTIYEIDMLANLIKADDVKNSRKHFETYLALNDSVIRSRKKAKNQFATIIYDSNKDKEENFELKNQKTQKELQLQRQKNRSYISYVVISISLLVLLFLIFYITTKGKREKNDAIFKSEMRISQKLHDELNSNIYHTLLFVHDNNLENKENKEILLSDLNSIYSKTRNISRENSKIPTDTRYILALKEMISEYKSHDTNIILNGFDLISWDSIDKNKKIILYRILQELLYYMKKDNNSNIVSIVLKLKDKKLNVLYVENSSEFASNQIILEKRLQNVENRIKTIKGTINFDTTLEKAFKINFTFPI
ncbi:ATP-binding protein [Flavobacterium panacagri]|uniref:ATP-binding protein n=1 Tax=Flavobacterium panacagri TaxID=3034146 RepID=UPI0025A67F8D|nr:tetratricopeptide repeat-containing sensor histidine kinase [Flavobacterium panacagri]